MKVVKILISALLLAALVLSSASCASKTTVQYGGNENTTDTEAENKSDFISKHNIVTYGTAFSLRTPRNPRNGAFRFSDELRKALEENTDDDAVFLVSVDIFADEEIYIIGRELSASDQAEEYERLAKSGIRFHKVKYRSIEGNLAPHDERFCALMTSDELKNFEPASNYGYRFSFIMYDSTNDYELSPETLSTYSDFLELLPATGDAESQIIIYGDPFDRFADYGRRPDNGKVLRYDGLKNKLEEHKGEDAFYLVNLEITKFDEGGKLTEISDEETAKEYARLSEESGIKFCEASKWFYSEYDPLISVTVTPDGTSHVYAMMTEEQIKNFEPLPEYGYTMYFPVNDTDYIINRDDIKPIDDFSTFDPSILSRVYC
ncbi:MAG: hypothetical protein HFE30_06715 [Clostridiales bacterium]|nr:hypothetical protein [Clostridiales bacterium]